MGDSSGVEALDLATYADHLRARGEFSAAKVGANTCGDTAGACLINTTRYTA